MAIGFANVEVHGRSAGWSPAAGLAYRFGTCLEDRRTGLVHDYRHRQDPPVGGGLTPIEAATFAPEGAPGWVLDPQQLATRLDKKEPRRDSQLMREILLALPRELEEQAALDLVARYVDIEFVREGMVAAVAVHRHDPDNPHAHVLLTMRRLEGEGFGNKERAWNDRGLVELRRRPGAGR